MIQLCQSLAHRKNWSGEKVERNYANTVAMQEIHKILNF